MHFTTAGLRTADTMPFWLDYVCKTYVPVDLSHPIGPGFSASGRVIRLGKASLTQVESSAVHYTRTRRNIKASDHGDYLLTLLTGGEMKFEQSNRLSRIGPGDLCLLDTAQPYDLNVSTDYTAIHFQIARDEFDRRLPSAERVSAMRVAADGRYARLAATMLQSTMDIVAETSPRQLAPTLIDLVALAFDESFSQLMQDQSRYAKIVARAQEVMSDHLLDCSFDLAKVPSAIGVSPRTLSRAFAQAGLTPSKWMWSKRLDAAKEMIQSARGYPVSEVAMACGFNDFSHFSRAFKAQFGVSPSTLRGMN